MSEISRLLNVFFAPGKAFADIAMRPRWWVPIVLASIMSIVFLNAFAQRVGFEQVVRQSIEQNGQNMTAQQREQAIAVGARIAQYSVYGGGIVGPIFGAFVVSVVLLFVFDMLMSAGIGLKRMMGIVSYAYLPTVIQSALSMVVLYLKPPEDFDLQNPLMFNIGAYLSKDLPVWLRSLGSSMDLFSFWVLALMAIGISAASRRMSFGKALGGLMLPWGLWVVARMGLATLRGS